MEAWGSELGVSLRRTWRTCCLTSEREDSVWESSAEAHSMRPAGQYDDGDWGEGEGGVPSRRDIWVDLIMVKMGDWIEVVVGCAWGW